jgi:hypothetical protein
MTLARKAKPLVDCVRLGRVPRSIEFCEDPQMTTTFGGSYASESSDEFHWHLECSIGHAIPTTERVHGQEAKADRVKCAECRTMDGPLRPHPTFGGRTHWA